MRKLAYSKRFKKSLKKLLKSGSFSLNELEIIIQKPLLEEPLEERHQNHKLSGVFEGCGECHIKSDLLFIYHIDTKEDSLTAFDIGSHSDLFE